MYPPPPTFGAPERFDSWRPGQYEAIQQSLASNKRFIVHDAPTGTGKTILACMESLMSGQRTVVLTANKPLQSLYSDEWATTGMLDVRGQSNYPCLASYPGGEHYYLGQEPLTVDEGACHFGEQCSLKMGGCIYYDKLRQAKYSAPRSVLNYDLWFATNRFSEHKIGAVPLLVCDEAHMLPEKLAQAMSVEITDWEVRAYLKTKAKLPDTSDPVAWARWANKYRATVANLVDLAKNGGDRRRASNLNRFKREIDSLAAMDERWMGERRGESSYFEPIWPDRYAEEVLFAGARKIVFMSATIVPRTLERLGIDLSEVEYFSYPSPFRVSNRPVWFMPTVRMHAGMDLEDTRQWVRRFDQIASVWAFNYRGLVHPVSYARQQQLHDLSSFRDFMLMPGRREVEGAIKELAKRPPPAILNFPAMMAGYDFAGDMARWQVIPKVPFPDTRSPIFAARAAEDSRYSSSIAAVDMMQATGRIVRGEDDWGHTIITDSAASMIFNNRDLFAQWWLDALRVTETIPQPKELMI